MHITIRQNKVAIGENYEIYEEGKRTKTAYSEILELRPTIHLNEWNNPKHLLSILRFFWFFGPSYGIETNNGKQYDFETKSFLKHHYQCKVGESVYDIYGHIEPKYSLFKDGTQIAYWGMETITWLEGDCYSIHANHDCNPNLLIAFCLIIDDHFHKKSSGLFTLNIGRMGFEAKKFDEDWEAKLNRK